MPALLVDGSDLDLLVAHADALSPVSRRLLAAQVRAAADEILAVKGCAASQGDDLLAGQIERLGPPPAIRLPGAAEGCPTDDERAFARKLGASALASGRVAAVLVAGGQGTRLGFPHPKGMFPLGPVSGRTLFEIHRDRLDAVGARWQTKIPLIVMTSPATHAETVEWFAAHDNFGRTGDQLHFLRQRELPVVDIDTKRLLLVDDHHLARAPDGHGGLVTALVETGLLEELLDREIDMLFYGQVDNPLTAWCDEELIGFHLARESEMTTQVVAKREPRERVGNVVEIDGRTHVLEYSTLDDFPSATERRNPDGSLALWAGNLAVHVIDLALIARSRVRLPLHRAAKKVPFYRGQELITPARENAWKFERFIFDLLPLAKRTLAYEVARETSFAPVKNGSDRPTDNPATAQAAMARLHRSWLAACGAIVPDDVPVEIHPSFALDAAGLKPRIARGLTVTQATYFA